MTTATAPKKKSDKSKAEQDKQKDANLKEAGRLVPKIKAAYDAVQKTLESGLTKAIEAGEHLAAAKELVGHGGWAKWVERNCGFSYRTARSYIRVYENRDKLPRRDAISYRRAIWMLRRDHAKKSAAGKHRHVLKLIDLASLKSLINRHKIDAGVDVLRPLLEELGIKVKEQEA